MRSTSDGGSFFTREQLDEMGEKYPPVPERRCPHCGRLLPQRAIEVLGRWQWLSDDCGCEGCVQAARNEAERAEAEERRKVERKYLGAGIARRYIGAQVSDERAASWLASFGENSGMGLYLHGCVGSGKTTLACALAKALIDAGRRAVVVTSRKLLQSIQDTFDKDGSAADAMKRYTECDLLVIDDIGKESSSDWSLGTMFDVINERYSELRPTVFTSQYEYWELGERFSRRGDEEGADAVLSRIRQVSTLIEMPKRNFRIEK